MKKVLIIDDDERNIFALTSVMRSRGFECFSANGGQAGLDILGADPELMLVLVDMMMPGMDGYGFLKILREMPAYGQVTVIAVTAQAMPGDREKCLASGADGYISKPVMIDKLLTVINGLRVVNSYKL